MAKVEQILDEWALWGLVSQPKIRRRLNKGLTNQSWLLVAGSELFALRINALNSPSLGVDRYVEQSVLALLERLTEPSITPKVLYTDLMAGYQVRYFKDGYLLSGPLGNGQIGAVATLLSRVHSLPLASLPQKSVLNIDAYMEAYWQEISCYSCDWLLSYKDKLNAKVFAFNAFDNVLCHNDPHLENFIFTPEGLMLIDWEYARCGSRYFDLATFSYNAQLSQAQTHLFLSLYFGKVPDQENCFFFQKALTNVKIIALLWYVIQSKGEKSKFIKGLLAELI